MFLSRQVRAPRTRQAGAARPDVELHATVEFGGGDGPARVRWVQFLMELLKRHEPEVAAEEDRLA